MGDDPTKSLLVGEVGVPEGLLVPVGAAAFPVEEVVVAASSAESPLVGEAASLYRGKVGGGGCYDSFLFFEGVASA